MISILGTIPKKMIKPNHGKENGKRLSEVSAGRVVSEVSAGQTHATVKVCK
jgi:hypothetical protein